MNDREQNKRIDESLQSGQGSPAFGEDARDFGEDGQKYADADTGNEHDIHRDPTIPPGLQPGERLPDEQVTGTTEREKESQ